VPRIATAAALIAALAVWAGASHAQSGPSSGPLWATVNECAPGGVGVRASLPGDGSGGRMRVRFSVQWFSHRRHDWLPVKNAVSPWVGAGSANYLYQERGWTFSIGAPPPGKRFLLRGVAEMQWLDADGTVTRNTTRVSRAGAGRASCLIQ
jgi:hypothetical protein